MTTLTAGFEFRLDESVRLPPGLTRDDLLALETAVASVDDSRWALAELAAEWKERGVRGWAEIIGAHPRVRRNAKTIYDWAAVAKFRNSLDVKPVLPYSFYQRCLRFLDKIPVDTIVEMMQEFEGEQGADVDTFSAELKNLAKANEPEPPALPVGQYNVIYADPPWQYDNTGVHGAANHHYQTLTTDEIAALPIRGLAADNAVLFMWVTNPFLRDAFQVIDAWGFEYKTNIVWVKTELQKPGSGFYVRGRHELLFICTRGNFTPLDKNIAPPIGSVIEAPLQEHSRKPDEVYAIIERLYPGCRYVELFARRRRENWDAWGNQVS